VEVTTPAGKSVALKWSPDGRTLTESDPKGPLTEQHFDALGRLVSVRDALGATTRYRYGKAGYLAEIVNPDGSRRLFQYDREGRVRKMVDELGGTAQWSYDEGGRRVETILPDGSIIRFEYDSENRLLGIQDSDGLWHRYEYDSRGLVTRQRFSDGRVEEYQYDGRGLLGAMTDPAGDVIRVERDAVGRLARIEYPDGSVKTVDLDPDGRWKRVERGGRVISREMSTEGLPVVEYQDDFRLERQFGPAGEVASVIDSEGRKVTYSYDDEGRVEAIDVVPGRWVREIWQSTGPARSHRFEYDRVGNLVTWTMPSGKVERRKYDLRRRLINQTVSLNDQLLLERQYEYNPLGRLVLLHDSRRGTRRFSYDRLCRLSTIEEDCRPPLNFPHTRDGDLALAGVRYAPAHRVVRVDDERWHYDPRGFVVRRSSPSDSQTFQHTPQGLLRSATRADGSQVAYEYDPHDRLVSRADDQGLRRYRWNGDQIWAVESDGRPRVSFLFFPRGISPLEQCQGEACYSVHTDHTGRILELIDDAGTIVWSSPAHSFGDPRPAPRGPESILDCPLGLPGQIWDDASRTYYNRYRFYDPRVAHFLSPDPIGIRGGLDAYRYPPDPVNFIDPLGLKCRGKNDDPHLYRGSNRRRPSEVCAQGFKPHNPNAGLTVAQHVEGVPKTGSNWISLTHDPATAAEYAEGGPVYVIANPGCGVEVDCDPAMLAKYGPDPVNTEHEIAFDRPIPPSAMLGYYIPNSTTGEWDWNPC
jgi:RHS repeat-associated protein